MIESISEHISIIESKYNVCIVYACESGSRAWGIENDKSDYDIRFLYVHKDIKWYLSTRINSHTINEMIDEGKLDFSGWDIKKAFTEFQKSNPSLIEFMQSPVVYRNLFKTRECFIKLISELHDNRSLIFHYNNMITSNIKSLLDGKDKVILKKYFHIIRPTLNILNLIKGDGCIFNVNINDLMDNLNIDEHIRNEIVKLIKIKKNDPIKSIEYINKIQCIDNWVQSFLEIKLNPFTLPKFYDKCIDNYKIMKTIVSEKNIYNDKHYYHFLTSSYNITVTIALYEDTGITKQDIENNKVLNIIPLCSNKMLPDPIKKTIHEVVYETRKTDIFDEDFMEWYKETLEFLKSEVCKVKEHNINFREIAKKKLYENSLQGIDTDKIDALVVTYILHIHKTFGDPLYNIASFSFDTDEA